MPMSPRSPLIWTLLALVACKGDTKVPSEPVAEPSTPGEVEAAPSEGNEAQDGPSPRREVQRHMVEHLERVDSARTAFVGGDLDTSRGHLAWLAEDHFVSGLPEGSEPHATALRQAAAAGAKAEAPAGVAVAMGEVGTACAACHLANKTGPVLDFGSAPDEAEGVASHMARHQYGLVAMWAGLVSGDDHDAWKRGTGILAEMHELDAAAFGVPELSAEASQRANNVHEVAAAAQTETDPAKRAEAYSTVLMGCQGCHAEMRGE